jgi:hypothetical protein
VNTQPNTEQNFTARRCMTRTATRRHADVNDFPPYVPLPERIDAGTGFVEDAGPNY